MKKLLLILIVAMLTLAFHVQYKYATTTDGKTVILNSNGTWEYVKDKKNSGKSTNKNSDQSNTSSGTTNTNTSKNTSSTKKSTGRTYITGPRGGCYYINSNGNKTYVDRSYCK